MPKVVVIGSLNLDMVVRVGKLPARGETVLGGNVVEMPGGKGANQAVAAAAQGVAVRLVGRVGARDRGPAYVQALRERGVDVTGIEIEDDGLTGRAFIVVDDAGENSIVVVPGTNSDVGASDVDRLHLCSGDVLLAQLEVPVPTVCAAIRAAKAAGASAILNLSPFHQLDRNVLQGCAAVIVNETEASYLRPGDVDAERLVITKGAQGVAWSELQLPALPVDVVDATGAGDAFAGAFAAGIAKGLPRADVLAEAIEAASKCVTSFGAQGWSW